MSAAPVIPDPGTPPAPAAPAAAPAPPPAAPAAPTSWHAQIQDQTLRDHPTIQRFKSLDDLAKEHLNVQPLIGAEKMPKPPADPAKWSAEQWNLHYAALGRPATAEEYAITAPEKEKLPGGYSYDGARATRLLAKMHEAGLSKSAAKAVFDQVLTDDIARYESEIGELVGKREDVTATLKKEWGYAASAKLAGAKEALIRIVGGQEAADEIMQLPLAGGLFLGDHLPFIRLMASLADKISEDGSTIVGGAPRAFAMSPDEAKRKIEEFRFEQRDKLNNESHPLHAWAHRQLEDLYKMARPPAQEG